MTIVNSRKVKYISHHFHKKHQNLTSPAKEPTSPVRENISSLREQHKPAMWELSLSPVSKEQSPVRVATKTGKKRQRECNDQEKKKSGQVKRFLIGICITQTDCYDSEFEKESQRV